MCLYHVSRKYQPAKTILVEVLGDKVDVCFSMDSKQFAVLGTCNSIIFIWDIQTFPQKFRISTSGFAIHNMTLPQTAKSCSSQVPGKTPREVFRSKGFEAILIKDFTNCHQSSDITDIAVSQNSKHLVTGGRTS